MKPRSTRSRRTAAGLTLLCLTMFVSSCATERVVVRTKYVPVTRPGMLSADCEKPRPRLLEKNGDLPPALKELETALDDCAAQVTIGREFDEEVVKEIDKLNKERSNR